MSRDTLRLFEAPYPEYLTAAEDFLAQAGPGDYSLIPTYATQRMPYKYLSSWICTMLTVRMVLAPSIGAALYTNVLQERQQHYVTRYAQNVDMLHPEASASFTQTVQGMQYQGKSKQEAINMAAISTKGRIQVQATLSAIKDPKIFISQQLRIGKS